MLKRKIFAAAAMTVMLTASTTTVFASGWQKNTLAGGLELTMLIPHGMLMAGSGLTETVTVLLNATTLMLTDMHLPIRPLLMAIR